MKGWQKVLIGTVIAFSLVGVIAAAYVARDVYAVYQNAKTNGLNDAEKKNFKAMEAWVAQMQTAQAERAKQQQQQRQGAPPVQMQPPANAQPEK